MGDMTTTVMGMAAMSDDDMIRRGDAVSAAANLYKWSVAAGEELEAAIRAIPATDARETESQTVRAEALKEAAAEVQRHVMLHKDADKAIALNLAIYGRDAILALINKDKP